MKAAVYHAYKLPDVVRIEDVAKPAPKDDEVLVRVRAASVNPLDAGLMKGKPLTFRLLFGLSKPRLTRPGVDVAGDVEAVGDSKQETRSLAFAAELLLSMYALPSQNSSSNHPT